MQPLQCDLQRLRCKTHYAERRQKLQLQNRMDLGATATKKTILKHFWKGILKGKSPTHTNAKIEEICWQNFIVTLMQPPQYDSRLSAAKDTRSCANSRSSEEPWCSHYNVFCSITWNTFHRRLQPLFAEKHKVSCSGFFPYISLPSFMWYIVMWCTVMWCKVSQFYVSLTRKIASQLPLIKRYFCYFLLNLTAWCSRRC